MPNREETNRSATTQEQESPDPREGEFNRLRQELAEANAARQTAERQLGVERARADSEEARAIQTAQKAAKKAAEAAQAAKDSLEKNHAAKDFLVAEQQARGRLRDFVQQSLSDILAGVDDAAVAARHRQLESGLQESGFITPGRVGSLPAAGRESTVEFDVAVVAGKQVSDHQKEGEEQGIGAKISFMDVIPLGFTAEASSRIRSERHSNERSDISRHNRVRFAVPVTFASLDEPAE